MVNIPSRDRQKTVLNIPIGGLNSVDNPSEIPDGMAQLTENIEINEAGGIGNRFGYGVLNNTPLSITQTGTVTSISGAFVKFGTGVIISGSAYIGQALKLFNATNLYRIHAIASNAEVQLSNTYTDTINTGSFIITPPVEGIIQFQYGTTKKLLAFGGGKVFSGGTSLVNPGGGGIIFSEVAAGLQNDVNYSFTTYKDKLFFCNGYQFQQYDGTAFSAVSGSPSPSDPKYVNLYTIGNANYLTIAGSATDANKSRLSFSEVNNETSWPAVNRYLVGDRDGGDITGIAKIPNGILILKTNGLFVFQGVPGASGSLTKISEVGCKSPKTIKERKDNVYFVGEDKGKLGSYVYAGGNEPTLLTESIDDRFNDIDRTNEDDFSADIYNEKYYVSFAYASNNVAATRTCYLNKPFSVNSRVFYPWFEHNLPGKCHTIAFDTTTKAEYLLAGSPNAGYVYRLDRQYADSIKDTLFGNSSTITFYYATKAYDFGDISVSKSLFKVFNNLYVDDGDLDGFKLDFDVYKDFELSAGDGATSDNFVMSQPATWSLTANIQQIYENRMTDAVRANVFEFRISGATNDDEYRMFPQTLYYKVEADNL